MFTVLPWVQGQIGTDGRAAMIYEQRRCATIAGLQPYTPESTISFDLPRRAANGRIAIIVGGCWTVLREHLRAEGDRVSVRMRQRDRTISRTPSCDHGIICAPVTRRPTFPSLSDISPLQAEVPAWEPNEDPD